MIKETQIHGIRLLKDHLKLSRLYLTADNKTEVRHTRSEASTTTTEIVMGVTPSP